MSLVGFAYIYLTANLDDTCVVSAHNLHACPSGLHARIDQTSALVGSPPQPVRKDSPDELISPLFDFCREDGMRPGTGS